MTKQSEKPPVMHVIAGPNGSGKSTLYHVELKGRLKSLPFVNADELAVERFGHVATTEAESKVAQRLAEERRHALMQERASFVWESTFSHPSRLALLDEARSLGYRIKTYHVHVATPGVAVARVAARVESGGHPVPEDRIRGRYERNQALIRQAVLKADTAYVYDNTSPGRHHRLAMSFRQGKVAVVGESVPTWARNLYKEELRGYTPERLNRAAHSFEQARELAQSVIGADARVYTAQRKGNYRGLIIGTTSEHVLQQVGRNTAVAHFHNRLEGQSVNVGERYLISYKEGAPKGVVEMQPPARMASGMIWNGAPADQERAWAYLELPPEEAAKRFPELLRAYVYEAAVKATHKAKGREPNEEALRLGIAVEIAAGKEFPEIRIREAPSKQKNDRER